MSPEPESEEFAYTAGGRFGPNFGIPGFFTTIHFSGETFAGRQVNQKKLVEGFLEGLRAEWSGGFAWSWAPGFPPPPGRSRNLSRREKILALVEAGATEGEREAARAALQRMDNRVEPEP